MDLVEKPGEDREVVEQSPLRLKDMDFTDLYLSEVGEAQIRNLKNAGGPLMAVPPGAIADISQIHRMVIGMGQRETESFGFDYEGVRYRATKIVAQESTWYALRRLMAKVPRLHTLGLHPMVFRALGRLGKSPNSGLILMAGATGNGKTTTICSLLLEYLLNYGDMAVTIEDPPELRLEGPHGVYGYCLQNKVVDGDFATPLRSVLRQNPRYILIGEIRDPEAASQALRAAISGHLVLATVHAGSVAEAITSLLKLVSSRLDIDLARDMIGDGLAAVLHQELKTIRAADGRTGRRAFVKSLFIANNSGLRAKIRDGQIHTLESEVDKQAARIKNNQSPVEGWEA